MNNSKDTLDDVQKSHQKVEEALRESEERFRTLLDEIPAIVWTVEPDGKVSFYNGHFYSYTGILKGSVEADWRFVLHPDDKQPTMEAWATATRTESPYSFEHRIKRADGQYRWYLSRGLPLRDHQGRTVKWLATAVDIDDQKRTLEELERVKRELENKNEELEALISIASHDLRTPLVNIRGFSGELSKDINSVKDVLTRENLSETASKKIEPIFNKHVPDAVRLIQTSAEVMNQMLKSLMDVAKSGTVSLKLQDIDMNVLFEQIKATFAFQLKDKSVEFSVKPLPACRGDNAIVMQIFFNLVQNAIKYLEPKRAGQIHVYALIEPSKVTYCVEDNGLGIAPEHLKDIFSVFYRLSPGTGEGEGVGLTIARRMAERLGGNLSVDSKLGKGSKFFVTLPR